MFADKSHRLNACRATVAALLFLVSGPQLLAQPDNEDCLKCHGSDTYADMPPQEVLEKLQSGDSRMHSKYQDITLDEVKAILREAQAETQ